METVVHPETRMSVHSSSADHSQAEDRGMRVAELPGVGMPGTKRSKLQNTLPGSSLQHSELRENTPKGYGHEILILHDVYFAYHS